MKTLLLLVAATCTLLLPAWSAEPAKKLETGQKSEPKKSALPPAAFADVTYGPHERNVLDLWQAKAKTPTPLLIFIHGGGWHAGDKNQLPPKLLAFMLKHGVSVASISYRYTSIAPLPAPVYDAARAVQYLRSLAVAWHLDPQRFAAYGISAGATTTLWLACHDDLADPNNADPVAHQSTRLCAAVALSPQTCLEPAIITTWVGDKVLEHPMIARAVGAKNLAELKSSRPEWVKLLHEFSPITHVSPGDPPILIQNPRIDPLPATSPGSAIHHAIFGQKFKEKADAAGVPCFVRLQDHPEATPEPEAFLLEKLARP
jgi:acetyl esterase/lipase